MAKLALVIIICFAFALNSRICAANVPKFSAVEGTSHDWQIRQVKQAFEDAVLPARVAVAPFDPCEEVFLRYFRPLEAAFVKHVFQTIANIPLNQELDSNNVVEVFSSVSVAQDLKPKFDQLEIAYGNHPTLPENKQD
ncbi:hypothetical protein CLAIMM_03328 [Cladophialophora immunda]|nr:hypothetical protein CLAIMM_03328 [Cladophialophora immunda]